MRAFLLPLLLLPFLDLKDCDFRSHP